MRANPSRIPRGPVKTFRALLSRLERFKQARKPVYFRFAVTRPRRGMPPSINFTRYRDWVEWRLTLAEERGPGHLDPEEERDFLRAADLLEEGTDNLTGPQLEQLHRIAQKWGAFGGVFAEGLGGEDGVSVLALRTATGGVPRDGAIGVHGLYQDRPDAAQAAEVVTWNLDAVGELHEGWLLSGTEADEGPDGEPLLDPDSINTVIHVWMDAVIEAEEWLPAVDS